MIKAQALLLAAVLLASAGPALAAESATLRISGIFRPQGCKVSLPDEVIDANLLLDSISSTPSSERSFNVDIDCDEQASVSVTLIDNRADSLASNNRGYNFGLGYADSARTRPLGGLKLLRAEASATVDGVARGSLGSSDGITWSCANDKGLANQSRQSAALTGTCASTALARGKLWIIPLKSQVMITENAELITERTEIDGSITLELAYY